MINNLNTAFRLGIIFISARTKHTAILYKNVFLREHAPKCYGVAAHTHACVL